MAVSTNKAQRIEVFKAWLRLNAVPMLPITNHIAKIDPVNRRFNCRSLTNISGSSRKYIGFLRAFMKYTKMNQEDFFNLILSPEFNSEDNLSDIIRATSNTIGMVADIDPDRIYNSLMRTYKADKRGFISFSSSANFGDLVGYYHNYVNPNTKLTEDQLQKIDIHYKGSAGWYNTVKRCVGGLISTNHVDLNIIMKMDSTSSVINAIENEVFKKIQGQLDRDICYYTHNNRMIEITSESPSEFQFDISAVPGNNVSIFSNVISMSLDQYAKSICVFGFEDGVQYMDNSDWDKLRLYFDKRSFKLENKSNYQYYLMDDLSALFEKEYNKAKGDPNYLDNQCAYIVKTLEVAVLNSVANTYTFKFTKRSDVLKYIAISLGEEVHSSYFEHMKFGGGRRNRWAFCIVHPTTSPSMMIQEDKYNYLTLPMDNVGITDIMNKLKYFQSMGREGELDPLHYTLQRVDVESKSNVYAGYQTPTGYYNSSEKGTFKIYNESDPEYIDVTFDEWYNYIRAIHNISYLVKDPKDHRCGETLHCTHTYNPLICQAHGEGSITFNDFGDSRTIWMNSYKYKLAFFKRDTFENSVFMVLRDNDSNRFSTLARQFKFSDIVSCESEWNEFMDSVRKVLLRPVPGNAPYDSVDMDLLFPKF